jgi:glycosyltransferase involved in cell wall biosynthesis
MAYYISDYWPTLPSAALQQLEAPSRRALLGLPKRLAAATLKAWIGGGRPGTLRFENPVCVTHAVRDSLAAAGIPVEHGPVIYGGTDLTEFRIVGRQDRFDSGPLKALFLGRLCPDKGVHTVVDAMALLDGLSLGVTLDIYGSGEPGYCSSLERKIRDLSLSGRVRMHQPVSRTEIPHLLSRHQVLVFASEWDEPFGRVLTEAMAAGLCVVGTRTGGAGEILTEEVNALSFPPGDAEALARQLQRLASDPALRRTLAETAIAEVRERFSLARMVEELEGLLRGLGPSEAAKGAA